MLSFLRSELKGISLFAGKHYSEITVTGFAALCLALNRYNPIANDWISELIYYAAVPILVILVLLHKNPVEFGVCPGNFKIWGGYVAVTCLAAVPVLYLASLIPSLRGYYNTDNFDLFGYFFTYVAILFSSEFFFRGFLLFGLKDRLKEASIIVQMIPFALIHFGKPEIETLSTIITGLYFGWVAYRGNSFWPAFFIHLFINVFFVTLVNLTP